MCSCVYPANEACRPTSIIRTSQPCAYFRCLVGYGAVTDLNTLIPPNFPLFLAEALSIRVSGAAIARAAEAWVYNASRFSGKYQNIYQRDRSDLGCRQD